MAVVALIKEIPLFGPLQDGEIAILAALLRRRSIKKGDEGTTRLAKRLRELARGVGTGGGRDTSALAMGITQKELSRLLGVSP
ncbi:MAG: hypothetical protein QG555_1081 [Thermodesulfobacteriota bacterium]|nr:hypothetical protein [Thermodesulfobacteriota bacterium]